MEAIHVLGTNTLGQIKHTIRNHDGTWQAGFGDVESQSGEKGFFYDSDCALSTTGLHVCGITSNGKLWHTKRHTNGTWQATFDDVGVLLGLTGVTFKRVSCAIVNDQLNICCVYDKGSDYLSQNRPFHCVLQANNTWQDLSAIIVYDFSRLRDIACCTDNGNNLIMTGINLNGQVMQHSPTGQVIFQIYTAPPPILFFPQTPAINHWRISCAYVGGSLNVTTTSNLGGIYHLEWGQQLNFGNIESQTGEAGVFLDVGCGEKNGQLHIVAVNTAKQILHTIRFSYTNWQRFFGNIETASGEGGDFNSTGVS